MAPMDSQNGTKLMEKDGKTQTPGSVPPSGTRTTVPPMAPVLSYDTQEAAVPVTARRPGWVTFAAVMTFIAAFWYALIALMEFANSTWFVTVAGQSYNLFNSHFFWWGMFDAAIAVLAVAAAASLLRGGYFGLTMGFVGAGVSMLRWLFYIPVAPWMALTIIALDILIVMGLCLSIDWFENANPS